MSKGFFDETAINLGWFDTTAQDKGWFDETLLDVSITNITISLTSSLITTSLGSLTSSTTVVLFGNLNSFSQGVVSAGSAVSAALTGISFSTNTAFLTSNISSSLLTASTVLNNGILVPTTSKDIASLLLSSSLESMGSSRNIPLLSTLITSSSGIISVYNGSIMLSLSGIQLVIDQGLLLPTTSTYLSSSLNSLQLGNIRPTFTKDLLNNQISSSQSSLVPTLTISTSGEAVLTGTGTLLLALSDITLSLSGQLISSSLGLIRVDGKKDISLINIMVGTGVYTLLTIADKPTIIQTSTTPTLLK